MDWKKTNKQVKMSWLTILADDLGFRSLRAGGIGEILLVQRGARCKNCHMETHHLMVKVLVTEKRGSRVCHSRPNGLTKPVSAGKPSLKAVTVLNIQEQTCFLILWHFWGSPCCTHVIGRITSVGRHYWHWHGRPHHGIHFTERPTC